MRPPQSELIFMHTSSIWPVASLGMAFYLPYYICFKSSAAVFTVSLITLYCSEKADAYISLVLSCSNNKLPLVNHSFLYLL
jgi:hypothetical protein